MPPELNGGQGIDQLDVDPHPVSRATNAAPQEKLRAELVGDLLFGQVAARVGERGPTGETAEMDVCRG